MKKFMFSAVALVAFSFAGMANTGGEEKLNKNLIPEIETLIETDDCLDYGIAEYDLADSWGATEEQATMIMNISIAICEGYLWSDIDKDYSGKATDW